MTEMMTESSVENSTPVIANYWGVKEERKHFLPDGTQHFVFKIMNEGDKVKFQKMTNQDLIVNRDNSARIKMDPATERHQLIETCVTGWKLYMPDGAEAKFSSAMLKNWLTEASPKLVEDLEFAIRKANPWMQADMSLEEVDKELDRLTDLKKDLINKQLGEDVSANK